MEIDNKVVIEAILKLIENGEEIKEVYDGFRIGDFGIDYLSREIYFEDTFITELNKKELKILTEKIGEIKQNIQKEKSLKAYQKLLNILK